MFTLELFEDIDFMDDDLPGKTHTLVKDS